MVRSFIVGVGMSPFIKPRGERETSDMGLEAATKALIDAGITYDAVEAAFCGYCYGDSCCGQRALYNLGMTGIPITNVNNNCSTGSTALYNANSLVKSGQAQCALALGFEQMRPGSLGSNFPDRKPPMVPWALATAEIEGGTTAKGPAAARMFGNGSKEYMNKFGGSYETLAKIAAKNHQHASKNPYSQFRGPWTAEQVAQAPKITENLSLLMCCPTSDGAACCIIASEEFVHAHHLENQAIEIVAQSMATDTSTTFESKSAMEIVGYSMTKSAADRTFKAAGIRAGDRSEVGVVELHDCFAANELLSYDALGLCEHGKAAAFVDGGDNTYGGKFVVNPSGGLEAKGHPLGATGLGMHFYITTQLRNWAGPMQAPGLFDIADKRGKYGLVHNIGLGGAVVVSLLRRPEFWVDGGTDGRARLGYNHAHEARPVTKADVEKARATKEYSPYILQQAKL
ncbi:hypothetical protein FRB95_010134 [Tulasnella sp. JGI-2019a]|nr:hypothetical protein FRB93_006970 [Tulasnella sp. JGI-2019a]KAG9025451.1 hypothetical protein FRB95_010134 [Tulasnella sp. JGI-2019a]